MGVCNKTIRNGILLGGKTEKNVLIDPQYGEEEKNEKAKLECGVCL